MTVACPAQCRYSPLVGAMDVKLARCFQKPHLIRTGRFFLTFEADVGMPRGYTLMLQALGVGNSLRERCDAIRFGQWVGVARFMAIRQKIR